MNNHFVTTRTSCIVSGFSAIVGVLMLATSFLINPGPPAGATIDQLVEFARENFKTILWGGWLQAVAPVFIVIFAFELVCLSRFTTKLRGWMTFFGATVLMMVSLIEITFYFCALFREPSVMGPAALDLIYSVQHLYFIVAAPAFFIPLGSVIIASKVLSPVFGWSAIGLGSAFGIIGAITIQALVLPTWVTALAGVQEIWWLAAGISLIVRAKKISNQA